MTRGIPKVSLRRRDKRSEHFFSMQDDAPRTAEDNIHNPKIAEAPAEWEPFLKWLRRHEKHYPVHSLTLAATVMAVLVAGGVGVLQTQVMMAQARIAEKQNALIDSQQRAEEKRESWMSKIIFRPRIGCFYVHAEKTLVLVNRSEFAVELLLYQTGNGPKYPPGINGGSIQIAPAGPSGDGRTVLYMGDLEQKFARHGIKSVEGPPRTSVIIGLDLKGMDNNKWRARIALIHMKIDGKEVYEAQMESMDAIESLSEGANG